MFCFSFAFFEELARLHEQVESLFYKTGKVVESIIGQGKARATIEVFGDVSLETNIFCLLT